MNVVKQSLSALILGISSFAFTAPTLAHGGLSIVYSTHDYGRHVYPHKQHYYSYRPAWYGGSHVLPRHHHKHDYGHRHDKHYRGHKKHTRHHDYRGYGKGHGKHDRKYGKHARHHDRHDYGKGHGKHRDRDSGKRHDSRRTHGGYARVDRH